MSSVASHFTISYARKTFSAQSDKKYKTKYKPTPSSKPNPITDISIPGVHKLFDKDQHIVVKVLWGLSIILSASFSLYQVSKRIEYYLSNPITSTVTVNQSSFIDYPTITLCSGAPVFNCVNSELFRDRYQAYFKEKNETQPNDCTNVDVKNITFAQMGTSLSELWKDLGVNDKDIDILSSCRHTEDGEVCPPWMEPIPMNGEYVDTIAGRCIVMSTVAPFKFNGPYATNLEIRIKNFEHNKRNNKRTMYPHIALLYLQDKILKTAKFDVISASARIARARFTVIHMDKKVFLRKNRPQTPCWTTNKSRQCAYDCMKNYLKSKINCSLPFVDSHSNKECSTWAEYESAWKTAMDYNFKLSKDDCPCIAGCMDIIYSMDTVHGDTENETHTVVRLAFRDGLIQVVEETFLYEFSAHLSDIGGNLGFFVGICVLTLLEILEAIFRGIIQHCKRPRKGNVLMKGYKNTSRVIHSYKH